MARHRGGRSGPAPGPARHELFPYSPAHPTRIVRPKLWSCAAPQGPYGIRTRVSFCEIGRGGICPSRALSARPRHPRTFQRPKRGPIRDSRCLSLKNKNHLFTGTLKAEDGTRTNDLLHGKCERCSRPYAPRPCAQTTCLQGLRPSERTPPNPSERRTLPFLPRSQATLYAVARARDRA
jgi:hypothetical protein